MALGDTIKALGHLYVLCSDPTPDGSFAGFNLTEKDFDTDQTCVVHVGDHPYVRKESVVAYKYGDLFSPERIRKLRLLELKNYGPVTDDLLLQIQKGAIKSPYTRLDFKVLIQRTIEAHKRSDDT